MSATCPRGVLSRRDVLQRLLSPSLLVRDAQVLCFSYQLSYLSASVQDARQGSAGSPGLATHAFGPRHVVHLTSCNGLRTLATSCSLTAIDPRPHTASLAQRTSFPSLPPCTTLNVLFTFNHDKTFLIDPSFHIDAKWGEESSFSSFSFFPSPPWRISPLHSHKNKMVVHFLHLFYCRKETQRGHMHSRNGNKDGCWISAECWGRTASSRMRS